MVKYTCTYSLFLFESDINRTISFRIINQFYPINNKAIFDIIVIIIKKITKPIEYICKKINNGLYYFDTHAPNAFDALN